MGNIQKKLYNQTELTSSVGWAESTGRSWMKALKNYIPPLKEGSRRYTDESQKKLQIIKMILDKGYNRNEILNMIKENPEISMVEANNLESKADSYDPEVFNTIPQQKELTTTILEVLSDGNTHTINQMNKRAAEKHTLTEEQLSMRFGESKDVVFLKRMRNARYSLKSEGYINEVGEAAYAITEKGLKLLSKDVKSIDREIKKVEKVIDPYDAVKGNMELIQSDLENVLLDKIRNAHWTKLESVVKDLMSAMGYGNGVVTQKTRDGGIDGYIKEDRLGLNVICLQAKRYAENHKVDSRDVRDFVGAVQLNGSKKGVLITTSSFSRDAREAIAKSRTDMDIVLIDGQDLVRYMIEFDLGVEVKERIVVKEVNLSFFEEE